MYDNIKNRAEEIVLKGISLRIKTGSKKLVNWKIKVQKGNKKCTIKWIYVPKKVQIKEQ